MLTNKQTTKQVKRISEVVEAVVSDTTTSTSDKVCLLRSMIQQGLEWWTLCQKCGRAICDSDARCRWCGFYQLTHDESSRDAAGPITMDPLDRKS